MMSLFSAWYTRSPRELLPLECAFVVKRGGMVKEPFRAPARAFLAGSRRLDFVDLAFIVPNPALRSAFMSE
jgi:hypothetical protein